MNEARRIAAKHHSIGATLRARCRNNKVGKSLASQPRLKVVDWPVVALASVPASDGYWSAQAWARERVPEHQLNAMLRNAEATTLQANAMPLWVIRLSA